MSELTDLLASINGAIAQVDGVTVPPITETMTVNAYLVAVDSMVAQALTLLDASISETIAAGRYVDVSVQLSLLRGMRESMVDMKAEVHGALDGLDHGIALTAAWALLTGSGGDGTDDGSDSGDTGNTNGGSGNDGGNSGGNDGITYPADDAVVLYGDTPMLLRANDAAVPAGAVYTTTTTTQTVTSPEISLNADGSWQVGTVTGSGTADAVSLIKDATVNGMKGLLGELVGSTDSEALKFSLQAKEAYDLGKTLSEKTGQSIDFITSGLEVLKGNKSLLEWNEEHNAFLNDTKNEFDAMAASTLASKVPIVGWVLSPVVDSFVKLSYKLQNTNSFEISVTANAAHSGGNKGGVFLAGAQDDVITMGNGDVLAAGGAGNDRFSAGSGKQDFLGGSGRDTVVYPLSLGSLQLTGNLTQHVLNSSLGLHTFVGIERLQFTDKKIALDLANGEAANMAVRLIGAALDKSGITPELVGYGLGLFDQGKSMTEAAVIAMATPQFKASAGSYSDEDFVRKVFTNVVGIAPDAAQLSQYVSLLNGHGGTMTQADLLVLAANTSVNETNIDLVGLQQTGVQCV